MAELIIMMLLLSLSVLCERVDNNALFIIWHVGSYINGSVIIASLSTSGINECLLHCVSNSNCVATNVDTANNICQLLSAIDCDAVEFQNGDWRVYHKKREAGCLVKEYKGCYHDKSNPKDFEHMAYKDDPENSPDKCANSCADAGYTYIGLHDRDECWCGESYGRYGLAGEDSHCWHNCTGDPGYKCGSGYKNSVYHLYDYRHSLLFDSKNMNTTEI